MGLLPNLDVHTVLALHCPLCGYHTHWINRLESHFSEDHKCENANFTIFQCTKCFKVASSKSFLLEHLEIHHKLGRESPSPRPNSPITVLNESRPNSANELQASSHPFIQELFSGQLSGALYSLTFSGPIFPKKIVAIRRQCAFCRFSSTDHVELSLHYTQHGIKNIPDNHSKMTFNFDASSCLLSSEPIQLLADTSDSFNTGEAKRRKMSSNELETTQNEVSNSSAAVINGPLLLTQTPLFGGQSLLNTGYWPFSNQPVSSTPNSPNLVIGQNNKISSQTNNTTTNPLFVPPSTSSASIPVSIAALQALYNNASNTGPNILNGNPTLDPMQQALLTATIGSPAALLNPVALNQLQSGQNASNINIMMAAALASMCNSQNGAPAASPTQANTISEGLRTETPDKKSKAPGDETINEEDFNYEDEDELLMPRPSSASSDTKVKLKAMINDLQSSKGLTGRSSGGGMSSEDQDHADGSMSSSSISPTNLSINQNSQGFNGTGMENDKKIDFDADKEMAALGAGLFNIRRSVGLSRTNLPFPARKRLFGWLVDHLREPYPSEEEKLMLAMETGLSRTTVNNWFINARRRYVKPLMQGRLVLQSGVFKTVGQGDGVTQSKDSISTTSSENSAPSANVLNGLPTPFKLDDVLNNNNSAVGNALSNATSLAGPFAQNVLKANFNGGNPLQASNTANLTQDPFQAMAIAAAALVGVRNSNPNSVANIFAPGMMNPTLQPLISKMDAE